MGCYVDRAGMRLHDVYKLNTNTERKGEGYGYVCLSVCPSADCLSDWLSDSLFVCQSVCLPICLPLSVCLSVCLTLFVCLSHSVSKNIYSGFAPQYQIVLYKLEVICLIFEVPFAVTIDLLNIWVVQHNWTRTCFIYEHEICLFCRLSSNIIRRPTQYESVRRDSPAKLSSRNTDFYLHIKFMLFTKAEHR